MPTIIVQIAQRVMQISTIYDYSIKICQPFEVPNACPEFSIRISQDEIDAEKAIQDCKAERIGCPSRRSSDAYLESLALCRKMSDILVQHGIVLMHGVVVAVDGQGYMFTAKSGTGKTTHSQLWVRTISGCYVVSGDKPYVFVRDGVVYACGTPWNGKERYGCNAAVPLKAIVRIQQSKENFIQPIPTAMMLPTLLEQSHGRRIHELKSILACTKAYNLSCNMEENAARVCFEGLQNNILGGNTYEKTV